MPSEGLELYDALLDRPLPRGVPVAAASRPIPGASVPRSLGNQRLSA
jgi:hypothetical protein